METSVKERLVGAIILVILLAIFVPELLSGPKRSDPVANTEGQAAPVRTYTIDLAPTHTPSKPPTPSEQQKPVALPEPAATLPAAPPTPEPAPTPEPPAQAEVEAQAPVQTPEPESKSGWAVQLGSFAKSENAERLVKTLQARGYKAFVSRSGVGAKTRYRVRVGPEKERTQAQKLAERLKREGQQVSIIPQAE